MGKIQPDVRNPPMTHILHRAANAVMPVAVGGHGHRDRRRRRAGATRRVRRRGRLLPRPWPSRRDRGACTDQLDALAYAHTGFFTTDAAERLADRLIEDAPPGLDHVYLVSGGSEAVEAALKMARQYFVENGEPRRRHFIARRQSYHGNTLGALAAGGNAWRRAQFEPLLIETHHIDPCYAYRLQRAGESECGLRRASGAGARRRRSSNSAPSSVIAFVAETVVGRDRRRGAAGRGLFQAHPRDLRPLRRAADPRRGDVRHGPNRHAARLRAGRHRARPDDHRQGPRRRLPADRRGAAVRSGSSTPSPRARASSSTATPIWATRWPRRPRSPSRTSSGATTCSTMWSRWAVRLQGGGSTSASAKHRHVGDIRGRGLFRGVELVARPRDQARLRPGAEAPCARSSAKRWRAA